MVITSADNPLVKKLASLKEQKYRSGLGMFLLEGRRIVGDYLANTALRKKFPLRHLIVREGSDTVEYPDAVVLSERAFDKISDTVSSQGVAAALAFPEKEAGKQPEGDFLALDGISDPGNMGAILRTAAACGFCNVYCIACADAYSPKAVRASMGGVLFVNIIKAGYDDISVPKGGLFAADMGGENIFGCKFGGGRAGLIIGGEARGVSEALKKKAKVVSLPMKNVESLNAAAAASVMMYIIKNGSGGF